MIGVGPGVCMVRTATGRSSLQDEERRGRGRSCECRRASRLVGISTKHVLVRPDPRNPHNERVLAANVDMVVIVASVQAPPLRTALIDRYLIAAQNGAMDPVIVVNKIDLLQDESELNELNAYNESVCLWRCARRKMGAVWTSCARCSAGKSACSAGIAESGKSSLVNALLPGWICGSERRVQGEAHHDHFELHKCRTALDHRYSRESANSVY